LLACTSLSKQKPQSEKKKKKSIEKEKVANLLVRVVKEESVACLLMSLVEPSIAKSVLPKPEGASERREPREKSEREGREGGFDDSQLVLQMLPRFSFPTNKVRNPKSQE
jgi:hypothetical protein